ncbi:MAG: Fic family protein [Deltaproteobacteria bacterium]|nr:Fic family protein [Deltaproteobacteria bacterium]
MSAQHKYIWQSESWPLFEWNGGALISLLGRCRLYQGQLLAGIQSLDEAGRQHIVTDTLLQSTAHLWPHNGFGMDANSVHSAVAQKVGMPHQCDTRLMNHYGDGALEITWDATQNYRSKLTPSRLFSWHAALFPTGYSGMTPIPVGQYRNHDDSPAPNPSAECRSAYQPPPSSRVATEMMHFFDHFATSIDDIDGIIRAGVLHLHFAAIKPFADGNGRLARVLTDMALAEDEQTSIRAYSMAAQMMQHHSDYCQILEKVTLGDGDITPWLEWFLKTLQEALNQGNIRVAFQQIKAAFWREHGQFPLKKRQSIVLNRMLDALLGGKSLPMTNREYTQITQTSHATAQRDLLDLVQKGCLIRGSGRGRSTAYWLVPPP